MKKIIYYANGGSGNHGCEAIIRSIEHIITPQIKSQSITISPKEDVLYGLSELVHSIAITEVSRGHLEYVKSYIALKAGFSKYALDIYPYKRLFKQLGKSSDLLALSVGGDNYCYGGTAFYYELDKAIHSCNVKTAMVGCSIEPEVLKNENVQQDLKSHSLIIARESITFEALKHIGLKHIMLLPDPAFALPVVRKPLPDGFINNNTIGINISPHVDKCSVNGSLVSTNVDKLIQHIIETTDLQIALIPHVVWPHSNDLDTLRPLYEKYKKNGRVVLIDDCNAEELKGYISRCRFMIAARTHASIAAYSTCVPTLVIGYSVKSLGIAKDIFGTYDDYVISAQSFSSDTDLIQGFEWLQRNENSIRLHLQSFMPSYCKQAYQLKNAISEICE